MRVGILGTGTMGSGMARSMKRAGLDVSVWNRTADKAAALADDGIEVAPTVRDAVAGADAVVTMLFDLDAVTGVAAEVIGAVRSDAVWIQSSTVGVDGIRRVASSAGDIAVLDAPVLGTKAPAEQGALTVLVSGDESHIERARPVFDAIGSKTIVAGGELGAASALKLACNTWILTVTAAAAQSLAIADGLGVDPKQVLEAIEGTASDMPYLHMKGKAMLSGDFTPAFGIDGGRKDLGLIHESAQAVDVDTLLVDAATVLYDEAAADGHGRDDLAAVITAFNPTSARR